MTLPALLPPPGMTPPGMTPIMNDAPVFPGLPRLPPLPKLKAAAFTGGMPGSLPPLPKYPLPANTRQQALPGYTQLPPPQAGLRAVGRTIEPPPNPNSFTRYHQPNTPPT